MSDAVKVRYVGPHTEGVEIKGQFCAHGDTIEVAHDIAVGLLEQADSWKLGPGEKKPRASKKPKADDSPESEQEN